MESPNEMPSLRIPPDQIGVIHSIPTKRWLNAKQKWDLRYAKEKRRVQLARGKEYIEAQKKGFLGGELAGELPPPSALAGRPSVQMAIEGSHVEMKRKKKNLVAWVWGTIGGKEDRENEEGKGEAVEKENNATPAAASI
jgi:hypothetical protein